MRTRSFKYLLEMSFDRQDVLYIPRPEYENIPSIREGLDLEEYIRHYSLENRTDLLLSYEHVATEEVYRVSLWLVNPPIARPSVQVGSRPLQDTSHRNCEVEYMQS